MEELLMSEILIKLQDQLIASMIGDLAEKGELEDFIKFGREEAKKDGMDTEELLKFFDELEEQYCSKIDWDKFFDIISATTNNRKAIVFNGDSSILIENRKLSNEECDEYAENNVSPIHLETLNKALESINVKLEFIEAINNPFPIQGINDFCRFKVIEIE